MALWAELDDDNKVIRVTVGDDNEADKGYSWLINNLGGRWVETYENDLAGIGWTYVEELGFYPPKPFESWMLNGLIWQAPKAKPEGDFYWDETVLDWIAFEAETI